MKYSQIKGQINTSVYIAREEEKCRAQRIIETGTSQLGDYEEWIEYIRDNRDKWNSTQEEWVG